MKELIDWDQQRLDVQIKYQQVVEQFSPTACCAAEMQAHDRRAAAAARGQARGFQPLAGRRRGHSWSTAFRSRPGSTSTSRSSAGRAAARASSRRCSRAWCARAPARSRWAASTSRARPRRVIGRAIGYVGIAGLPVPGARARQHRSTASSTGRCAAAAQREAGRGARVPSTAEARRTGNSELDINADWIDYEAAGCAGRRRSRSASCDLLHVVDLEETIFELGLRSAGRPASAARARRERVLDARRQMRERLESLGIRDWVERFDPERYNRNATVAENLLFGTPVGRCSTWTTSPPTPTCARCCARPGCTSCCCAPATRWPRPWSSCSAACRRATSSSRSTASSRQDDLPQFEAILKRADEVGLKALDERETRAAARAALQADRRPAPPRPDRRGLRGARDRGAAALRRAPARGAAAARSSSSTRSATTPPPRCRTTSCSARSSPARPARSSASPSWCASCSTSSACGPRVVRNGLDFQVGVGGARLPVTDRQKVALVRALLKRPVLLVLDQAAAVLDAASQQRVVESVLAERKGRAWSGCCRGPSMRSASPRCW